MTGQRPVIPPGPVEIVRYSLALQDDHLLLDLTLGEAPPFGDESETYRYWLAFIVELSDGRRMSPDVRVHADAEYRTGLLVAPNEHGNVGWGDLPVTWNGTILRVTVPMPLLRESFADPALKVGPNQGSADGPSRFEEQQGYPFGAIFYDSVWMQDFRPLQACKELPPEVSLPSVAEAPVETEERPVPTTGRSTPLIGALPLLGILIAATAARRQGLK